MAEEYGVREKTFEEELPYFKERLKEVLDNYHNSSGGEDPLYVCVLYDSSRIIQKAEKIIKAQADEIKLYEQIIKDKADIFANNLQGVIKDET